MYDKFSRLNSDCKRALSQDFLGPNEFFDFWWKLLYFPFFSSKSKNMYARFSLLYSYCKPSNIFSSFWGPNDFFDLFVKVALFSFLFLQEREMYARFSLLPSYCKIALFQVFGAQPKCFIFWSKLLIFPFSKNKKMYARVSVLNSYRKRVLFRVFGALMIFSIFGKNCFIFLFCSKKCMPNCPFRVFAAQTKTNRFLGIFALPGGNSRLFRGALGSPTS